MLIQCAIKFDLQKTYIFQYYLMNKPHSLDIGSEIGQWPVFHG